MKKPDVLVGIEVGEHIYNYDRIIFDMKKMIKLDVGRFILIRGRQQHRISPNYIFKWARLCKDNHIYFAILYSQTFDGSSLSREIVEQIKEIAGNYYIGDMIGETGGMVSRFEGYYKRSSIRQKLPYCKNLQEARDRFVNLVKKEVSIDRQIGIDNIMCVEPTAFHRYNCEAGVDTPLTELMVGNPEIMLASVRGTARAYRRKQWGCHIANEWYGGYKNDDPLKQKRFKLALYYSFLAGANYIYPESGLFRIESYGSAYTFDSKICKKNRQIMKAFVDFTVSHKRPKYGPFVKIGIIQGNLDGWTGWGSTTLWSQFGRDEWIYGDSEKGWSYLEEFYKNKPWYLSTIFGKEDFSGNPPYGQYDIVPIESPLKVLLKYSCLIFLGWNTMTKNIYKKLKAYVKKGGHLVAAVPHLNIQNRRNTKPVLINNGDIRDLFGCSVEKGGIVVNQGIRFVSDSSIKSYKFPSIKKGIFIDPICASGKIKLANIRLTKGKIIAQVADNPGGKCHPLTMQYRIEKEIPILIEHNLGKGTAFLITSWDYPGAEGLKRFMEVFLNAVLIGEQGDIKLVGSDKIRYAVYVNDSGKKFEKRLTTIYLLNTSYDVSNSCRLYLKDLIFPLKIEECNIRVVTWRDGVAISPFNNMITIENIGNDEISIVGRGKSEIELISKNNINKMYLNNKIISFRKKENNIYIFTLQSNFKENILKID